MPFLRRWLPVILWTALILVASGDSFASGTSGGILRFIFGRDLPQGLHVLVRKMGHVFEYGVLALLAWRAQPEMWPALLVTVAVAITDETRQSFTLSRTGSPWDVLLDVCAAFLVLVIVRRRSRQE